MFNQDGMVIPKESEVFFYLQFSLRRNGFFLFLVIRLTVEYMHEKKNVPFK